MLSELHMAWLTEKRRLRVETLERFGIHSGRHDGQGVVADARGAVLVFPYFDRGELVNEKYRIAGKKFWQWSNDHPGKRATFFNADALDAAAASGEPLVICEGEIDCLSAAEAGWHAVSVPDGAPSDKLQDDSPKLQFLWNNRERTKAIKSFVLAVDDDVPGRQLAEELCRCLSPGRCLQVSYPEGCKDINDVLVRHDAMAVHRVLYDAKPYPVRGLYQLNDYPAGVGINAVSSGWLELDRHFKPFRGGVTVIAGIPSHGKSSFAINLLVNLAQLHGWRSVIFSPEMPTEPFLRASLLKVIGGELNTARVFAQEHFYFIDADPKGIDETEDFTLTFVLDKAAEAVMRYGVNCVLIDPWNELEAERGRNETTTDYIGRALRAIKRFARERKVVVLILAHPSKAVWSEGKTRRPTLYDIADSAHFYNKCDHGIVVWRDPGIDGMAVIHVDKSRFRDAGERGEVKMIFSKERETFETLSDPIPGDVSDALRYTR